MSHYGIQIELKEPDDFLLVKESLTRIGVASNKTKTLYQSAHILHKRGLYYICHFKELFLLDGRVSDISNEDYERRNTIVKLLQDWGLLTIKDDMGEAVFAPVGSLKILAFKDKDEWTLESKYNIGKKKGIKYD